MKARLRLTLAFAVLGATVLVPEANACQCAIPPELTTTETRQKWLFDQADNVVQGQVVAVRTRQVVFDAMHPHELPITATFRIEKVLKGSTSGTIKLLTGSGDGDCGLGYVLSQAVSNRRLVTLEIRRFPKKPDAFLVNSCLLNSLQFEDAVIQRPKN